MIKRETVVTSKWVSVMSPAIDEAIGLASSTKKSFRRFKSAVPSTAEAERHARVEMFNLLAVIRSEAISTDLSGLISGLEADNDDSELEHLMASTMGDYRAFRKTEMVLINGRLSATQLDRLPSSPKDAIDSPRLVGADEVATRLSEAIEELSAEITNSRAGSHNTEKRSARLKRKKSAAKRVDQLLGGTIVLLANMKQPAAFPGSYCIARATMGKAA